MKGIIFEGKMIKGIWINSNVNCFSVDSQTSSVIVDTKKTQ